MNNSPLMIVLTYPALFGPECRAFTTSDRAERWAIQAGYAGRSTLYAGDCFRLYRCRAYHRRLTLFPDVTYRCGRFLNDYHFEQLLKHWSGCKGAKADVRYHYDDVIDDESVHTTAFEIVDHRDQMAILSRPDYIVGVDRAMDSFARAVASMSPFLALTS